MSVNGKRILSNITYYTLAILTLLATGFFIYCLSVKDVAGWAKTIYYIWSAVVIGVTIFDVICTNSGEGKFVSGIVVYVLSILAVAMACILYFVNSGMEGLATDFFNLFISVSMISLLTTGFMIATWVVGEHFIERRNENNKLDNTKV